MCAEECCDIIDRLDLSLSQSDSKLQAARCVCAAVWLHCPSLPLSITGDLQSCGGVIVVFALWEPLVRRGYGLAGCDPVCRRFGGTFCFFLLHGAESFIRS